MYADLARWGGRFIGGIGVLMWTFALVAQNFVEPIEDGLTGEAIGLTALAAANVVAFFVSLRYEHWGATACVVAGTVFSLFAIATAGHNHLLAALVSGGPFIFTGTMLWLAAYLEEHGGHQAAITTT